MKTPECSPHRPLDGGTVELVDPDGDQVKHRVYTDSRGAFAFREC